MSIDLYLYLFMSTYVYLCIFIYNYVYYWIFMYIHLCKNLYLYMQECLYIKVFIYVCIYISVYIYCVCVYIYARVYIKITNLWSPYSTGFCSCFTEKKNVIETHGWPSLTSPSLEVNWAKAKWQVQQKVHKIQTNWHSTNSKSDYSHLQYLHIA